MGFPLSKAFSAEDCTPTNFHNKTMEDNLMDKLFLRMEHIPKQIFEELNFQSLMNARLVSPSWEQFIDDRAHQWSSFKKEISDMEEESKDSKTPFHLACKNGRKNIVEIIM